ncbi:MAG TPA: NADH-quinone oxidoreductase subunit NuoG, partial [Chloroflexota bacterium]
MSELVTLTINGRTVSVPKGTLLVEAAKQVGVEIPVFCYHPKLKPVGACRMCLVEIEKMPRLQTACTTPVADGMVVHTASPNVIAAQNGVIELLLANHPLDCPICDKGGECPLQDNTFKFGLGVSRFTEEKRRKDKAFPLSDRIVLDRERCIMCLRCVRFHQEIPGDEALAIIDRGGESEIGVLDGETYDSPFSGNTIDICPVGALTSRQYRFRARPWDLKRTPAVCVGCSVGCNVELHSRDGRVLRLVPRENLDVNDAWLCDFGRFDTVPVDRRERPQQPLVRRNGALVPASWDEALERAAALLREGSVGVVASPTLTNEAVAVLAGPLRSTLASRGELAFWPQAAPAWPLHGRVASLGAAKTVVLVGLDPWRELPVLALWVRKATLNGAKLVVVGETNGLHRDTHRWLKTPRGREGAVVRALLAALEGQSAPEVPEASADTIRSTATELAARPAVVLAGPSVVQDDETRGLLERLAAHLGADGTEGSVVGSPPLSANGAGVALLAPELATVDAAAPGGVFERARSNRMTALLFVGLWPEVDAGRAKLVVAASGPLVAHPNMEVLLPLAHPYEQDGSLTNLEGRVQRVEAGGLPPREARPDWYA